MAATDRIRTLKARHKEIDDSLTQENNRPHPDDSLLKDLKLQKLRLKDEIRALKT
ncbi:MAG: DUF465 domain-containing protein [Alphaproteobacteria bacterium]